VFARVLEICIELAMDLSVSIVGDTDTAWLGDAFEPGGNIHTLPEYVTVLDDDVANVYTDAQFDVSALRYRCIALDHASLDLNGAAGGIHGTCELNQDAIAGSLDDAAAIISDLWFQELAPMSIEPRKRALLVGSH
jgi:hypothetical protein